MYAYNYSSIIHSVCIYIYMHYTYIESTTYCLFVVATCCSHYIKNTSVFDISTMARKKNKSSIEHLSHNQTPQFCNISDAGPMVQTKSTQNAFAGGKRQTANNNNNTTDTNQQANMYIHIYIYIQIA